MPLPRMTTRRWMIVVAVLALVSASAVRSIRRLSVVLARQRAAQEFFSRELAERASADRARADAQACRKDAGLLRRRKVPPRYRPPNQSAAQAEALAALERDLDGLAAFCEREAKALEARAVESEKAAEKSTQEAERLARLQRRYVRAADNPDLPVLSE